jgi:hypothetical protein
MNIKTAVLALVSVLQASRTLRYSLGSGQCHGSFRQMITYAAGTSSATASATTGWYLASNLPTVSES